MNFNMLIFPSPKLSWNWKTKLGELIWIPIPTKTIKPDEFYQQINRKAEIVFL